MLYPFCIRNLRVLGLICWGLSLFGDLQAQRPEPPTVSLPVNLGANINSGQAELVPRLSPDGQTLYFVRIENRVQNIWISDRAADGSWAPARRAEAPLNLPESSNGVYAVMDEGQTLLLMNIYLKSQGSRVGVSMSHRREEGWSRPRPLDIRHFENLDKYLTMHISADRRILLLSIQTMRSMGRLDLYVSFLQPDGSYSEPLNLGQEINTPKYELSPFLAPDLKTLYFSSNGHDGQGDADIFMARRLDDTWTAWTEPVNLGTPINTPKFDAYFCLNTQGDTAYYTSMHESFGESDIFRVRLPEAYRPEPGVRVAGTVRSELNGWPLGARIVAKRIPEGTVAAETRSDSVSGQYRMTLPGQGQYILYAERAGVQGPFQELHTGKQPSGILARDLTLPPTAHQGAGIRLENVLFDFARSELRETSYEELEQLAAYLLKYPRYRVRISGHTDNVGSDARNQALSEARAEAVKAWLVKAGVAPRRIATEGFADRKPLDSNDTSEGRQQNRRVEFLILDTQ